MIIITGATSGLGKSLKEYLLSLGEKIITISRSNVNCSNHYKCDIGNYESLKEIYRELNKKKYPIKAIINCAGIASMNLAITTPSNITEKIIRTNLLGTIFTNQIFAPLLIRNKGGRIINFSTIAVGLGLSGESVYIASKSGVEGFSRTLAKELAPFNITVNCIAPGPIKTNLIKGISDKQIKEITSFQIIKKLMTPNDINQLVQLLLSDKSKNITGQVLHLGGF